MTCFPEHRVAHCLGVFGRLAELGRRCSRSCSRGRGMRERRGFRRLRFPGMERPRKEDLGDNGGPFSFVESFDFGFLEKGCTRCENSSGFLLGDVIWCVCFFYLSLSLFSSSSKRLCSLKLISSRSLSYCSLALCEEKITTVTIQPPRHHEAIFMLPLYIECSLHLVFTSSN